MEILKVRKQGNSLIVDDDDFFDFDEDILRDLVSQGYEGTELINQFSKIKKAIPGALDRLVEEAKESKPLSKEEAAREFGI